MATAFGAKRPKIGRTVEDIARMSPEEWRELQDEMQREYAKRYLGLWDATAAVRRFQKDAESARQRRARPLPFGGGAEPFGGTIGGSPIQIGAAPAGVPVEGVLPYPPYPPERGAYTLDFEMTAPSPSGSLPLGPGGPLGVSRPTVPGTLPVSGAGLPLGPQTGAPGSGFGTGAVEASIDGRPVAAELVDEGGGFDPKIAAMLLASVSDAVKENLTLQGARGAKGTAAPNLLQLMEQERRTKHEDMTYRLELSKWLSEEPERRLKSLTSFADLAVKVGDLASTADPEQQKVIRSGLEQQAEQLGMPKSWVGDYLGQGQAALGSIRDLLPHIDPASLQLLMMQSKTLLKSGKFLETAQQAASFGIRGKIGERLPNVLASLNKQPAYQGKDKPFDLVVDLVAGEDRALRDYLMGATAPKDEYERLTKRLSGMGVAMPEAKAEIKAAVEKQEELIPGAVEQARRTAEATEESRERVAAATGRQAKELELGMAQTKPLDHDAVFWIDPKSGKHASPSDTLKTVKEKNFVPVTQAGLEATASARAALVQLKEYRELAPKLLVSGTGTTPVDLAKVQGNRARLAVLRRSGDPAVKRLDALTGAIATLARATGDTANIAVQERKFLQEFVLTDEDTIQSAAEKLDQAERILRGVMEARGIPVPGAAGKTPGKATPAEQEAEQYLRGR